MSELTFRVSTREDIPRLREIYIEAFGDPPEFAEAVFSGLWRDDNCYTLVSQGEICSYVFAFPCVMRLGGQEIKAAYIYAFATAKKFRGRGAGKELMERLWSELLKKGFRASVLVPAEKGLFDYYGKIGYTVISQICRREYEVKELCRDMPKIPSGKAVIRPASPKEYKSLRRRALGDTPYLEWGEEILSFQEKMFRESGGGFFAPEKGGETFCAAAERWGSQLFIKELALPCEMVKETACLIASHLEAERVKLYLEARKGEYMGISPEDFAMARADSPELLERMKGMYLSLVMD